jgi:formyltetrahydrofolate hydrolase
LFDRLAFQTLSLQVSRENLDVAFAKPLATSVKVNWRTAYTVGLKQVAIMELEYDHALGSCFVGVQPRSNPAR